MYRLICVAAALGCVALAAHAVPSDLEASLAATETAFAQTALDRDVEAFRSFLAPDVVFSTPHGDRRGPDAVVEAWAGFFVPDGPSIHWRPGRVSVLDDGSLGLVTGPFRVEGTGPDGASFTHEGVFFSVWRRDDAGNWKIVFDTGDDGGEGPVHTEDDEDSARQGDNVMTRDELVDFATGYAAAWSGGNPAALAAHYAVDGVLVVNDGEPSVGREAIAAKARSFMEAFPDMVVSLVEVAWEADRAVFRWHWTGTNTGPGGTGHSVDLRGQEAWTFDAEGRIGESRGQYDKGDYERQVAGE